MIVKHDECERARWKLTNDIYIRGVLYSSKIVIDLRIRCWYWVRTRPKICLQWQAVYIGMFMCRGERMVMTREEHLILRIKFKGGTEGRRERGRSRLSVKVGVRMEDAFCRLSFVVHLFITSNTHPTITHMYIYIYTYIYIYIYMILLFYYIIILLFMLLILY